MCLGLSRLCQRKRAISCDATRRTCGEGGRQTVLILHPSFPQVQQIWEAVLSSLEVEDATWEQLQGGLLALLALVQERGQGENGEC